MTQILGTRIRLEDGSTWPLPADGRDELVWRLTYATPSKEDLRRAAAIISAYGYLLTETTRERREQVCREIRRARRHEKSEGGCACGWMPEPNIWSRGSVDAQHSAHRTAEQDES